MCAQEKTNRVLGVVRNGKGIDHHVTHFERCAGGENTAIESGLELGFNRFLGIAIAVNRNGQPGAERGQTLDVIAVLVGKQDALQAIRSAVGFQRISGTRWSDLIREGLAMRRTRELTWAQVLMAANTPMLLRAAMVEGDTRRGVMASGQVVGLIDELPTCQELIDRIMAQAEATLARLEGSG